MSAELCDGFEQLLLEIEGAPKRVVKIDQRQHGPQGASGSQVNYYEVACEDGVQHTLVTKSASLLERRIVNLLSSQKCAVPPVYIPDVTSEGRALIFMPFLHERPPQDLSHFQSALTQSVADGLAGIHIANRQKPQPWLPHTSADFSKRLWLYAWREEWEKNLRDAEFLAEFGVYDQPLKTAMENFMRVVEVLTAESETLTLLNVDLIPDHIRLWRGEARFIDWEQSSYGTLYLDLPNYFSLESALSYRDALARHGHEIPVMEFMERFREVGRYMGLRYLGYSLWCWGQGGDTRRNNRWFLYYTLTLALRGR